MSCLCTRHTLLHHDQTITSCPCSPGGSSFAVDCDLHLLRTQRRQNTAPSPTADINNRIQKTRSGAHLRNWTSFLGGHVGACPAVRQIVYPFWHLQPCAQNGLTNECQVTGAAELWQIMEARSRPGMQGTRDPAPQTAFWRPWRRPALSGSTPGVGCDLCQHRNSCNQLLCQQGAHRHSQSTRSLQTRIWLSILPECCELAPMGHNTQAAQPQRA